MRAWFARSRWLLVPCVLALFGSALLSACNPPPPNRVIWILMENHSYNQIVGSSSAPFINKTLIPESETFTNWHSISHPSLPNYVAMTSGLSVSQVQKFTSDCDPSSSCSTSAKSIFSQLGGSRWRAYEESMPSNCDASNSGEYAVRHNPPPYYSTLTGCSTNDVPLTKFATDWKSDSTAPSFAFITPNVCSDMHDCSVATGDTWLKNEIATIKASPVYQEGTTDIFMTSDEGSGGSTGEDCSAHPTDESCHVLTTWTGAHATIGKNTTNENHIYLLHLTEYMLGLASLP